MSGQGKRTMKKREAVKLTNIHRIRKRLHTTVAPETYEYLKETALDVGRLLDTVVSESRKTREKPVLIYKSEQENGLVVIRTRDLRRVKATSF